MSAPHFKLEELTPEQMQQLEANSKLLKIFSGYIADLEQSNPGVQIPADLLYTAFMLGCIAVTDINKSVTMHVAAEVHGLRALYYTMKKQQERQDSQPAEVPAP